jgi:hypothetical protein
MWSDVEPYKVGSATTDPNMRTESARSACQNRNVIDVNISVMDVLYCREEQEICDLK